MSYSIKVTKSGKMFEGKATQIVAGQLEKAMIESVSLIERNVKKLTPRGVGGAQGGLLARIEGTVVNKGTPFVEGMISSNAPHVEVIEKGRGRNKRWPPEGVLIRWIEKKIKTIQFAGSIQEALMWAKRGKRRGGIWSGKVSSISEGVAVSRAKRTVEFLIRRKIGKKGFKGFHMFEKGLNNSISRLTQIFNKMGLDIARELSE